MISTDGMPTYSNCTHCFFCIHGHGKTDPRGLIILQCLLLRDLVNVFTSERVVLIVFCRLLSLFHNLWSFSANSTSSGVIRARILQTLMLHKAAHIATRELRKQILVVMELL